MSFSEVQAPPTASVITAHSFSVFCEVTSFRLLAAAFHSACLPPPTAQTVFLQHLYIAITAAIIQNYLTYLSANLPTPLRASEYYGYVYLRFNFYLDFHPILCYSKAQELVSQALSRQCPILDILIVNISAMS